MPEGPGEDLHDPALDEWLAGRLEKIQPLHSVGPVEREAAEGAWEWGACLDTGAVDGAQEFLAAYAAAGGAVDDDVTFRQYARARMRSEILRPRF